MTEPEDTTAGGPEVFGPYVLLGELGAGGQGTVHLAEDTRLKRRVALKVLSRGPVSADRLRRFRREAEAASRLEHPGICAIHEAGEVDGQPYIAMRLIPGQTLQQRIGDRVLGKREDESQSTTDPSTRDGIFAICRLFEKAAIALHRAHEHGLIHRDIKPGNIMVTPDGEPVILDFGLARDELDEDVSLTQSGDLLGTPAYMSPEQLMAQRIPLDRRTDIYSLGATLYECLTLRRPFEATTRAALYQRILGDEPSRATSHNRQIPRDLEVVLETALEKNRDRRYQTALDLADDLRRVRTFEPVRAKPIGRLLRLRRWAQRHPVLASTSALLAVAFVVTVLLLAQTRAALRRSEALLLVAESQGLAASTPVTALRIALDAVDLDRSPETVGQVRNALALPLPAERIPEPRLLNGHQIRASGDGRRLLTLGTTPSGETDIVLRSRDGSPIRRTAIDQRSSGNGGFSPGGTYAYAFSREENGDLQIWRAEDGAPVESPGEVARVRAVCWTPDDRLVASVEGSGSIELLDLAGRERASIRPADAGPVGSNLALDPDGATVVLGCDAPAGIERWALDGTGVRTRVAVARPPRDLAVSAASGCVAAVLDGGALVFCDGGSAIRTPDVPETVRVMASPDGARFVSYHESGPARLWDESGRAVAALERPGTTTFAAEVPGRRGYFESDPFSPDGTRLATRYPDRGLCVWDRDGRWLASVAGQPGSTAHLTQWSPDGSRLYTATALHLSIFDADGRIAGHMRTESAATGIVELDESHLWVAVQDSLARWELGRLPFRAHDSFVRAVVVHGSEFFTGSDNGRVRHWRRDGVLLAEYGPVSDPMHALAVSDDGRWLAAGGDDGAFHLWRTGTAMPARSWRFDLDVKGVRFLEGEPVRVVATGWFHEAWICSADGSAVRFDIDAQGGGDNAVHGGAIMTGVARVHDAAGNRSGDAGVRIWRPETGWIQTLRMPGGDTCEGVQCSADGLRLAASDSRGLIHLWQRDRADAPWPEGSRRLEGHEKVVWTLDFSADGELLLSSSSDGTARIWSADDGRVLAVLRGHVGAVRDARFLPGDREVITVGADGYVRRFLVDDDEVLARGRALAEALGEGAR